MLPCRVRVRTLPLPKSMRTIGTGRTLSQTGSKYLLTNAATSSRENNTVLARRAFVQQNWSSSLPIIWNSRTGFFDLLAAAQAAARVGCQRTLPGSTFGLTNLSPVAAAGAEALVTIVRTGGSMRVVLEMSRGGARGVDAEV